MRIACLQFAPEVGDVENNIRRANIILEQADLRSVDLLVLPELAFAGYKFRSLKHITPYLEDVANGITAHWARTTAKKYNCFVVVGYAETVDVRKNWPTDPKYYNSAMMVNPTGETVVNYRKTHLYCLDETWALEGPEGLYDGNILGLGDFTMGIGMDLNPCRFTAPASAWEFAHHVLYKDAKLVIISMAWMTSQSVHRFTAEKNMPDLDTMAYWLSRLEPLIRREFGGEITVVISSRCGIDDGIVYAGTSCVLGIQEGEVKVYGMLGCGNIELLIVDTTVLEKGKLVAMQKSPVAEDVLQGRKAREYLASNQLADKERRVGRERSSQVSPSSRDLIRAIPRVEVKPLDKSLFPPDENISQYRFFSSANPSSIGRREKRGSHWLEASPSVSAAPTSSVEPLLSLNSRTFVESGASQVEVDSWDIYSDDSIIAPPIDTARPTQLRSGTPDDGPDSASSMTVNSPWDDDYRSVLRAADFTTAIEIAGTRLEHGTPRDVSPTLPSFVHDPSRVGGSNRQPSNSIISTASLSSEEPSPSSSTSIVPPLFPSSVPRTERPQSPKSRNTSRPGSSQRASTSVHQDLIDQLEVITVPFEPITAGLSVQSSSDNPLPPDPEAGPTPSAEGSSSPRHQNYIW